MNAPRFMKEYATYAKKKIMAVAGDAAEKKNACDQVDRMVSGYEKGMLLVDEVMNEISTWVWRCR